MKCCLFNNLRPTAAICPSESGQDSQPMDRIELDVAMDVAVDADGIRLADAITAAA